ncbi:PorV/PorQ family protein [candidate division KSB1 bacterium]|nr:PorV/PorQ family protein [candidate division KSB1 bacterium]NIR69432.1 PorV/PorQ family protein [candidate division KSB1 bacterium]NIS22786.1 PorV/PorQ family protein [candidate division KSB1 bacterium]NIT69626.1 PorV/PorQ family protein [candidate division KSB1 bacterium]NIU23295.1 PorV/PorQ family protein [candidate division KSB1 bacterium]
MRNIKSYACHISALVFLLTVFCAGDLSAQFQDSEEVKKVGTSAAAFLRIPVGVRGTALGGAFVSIADDASAMFWNPSGIARVEDISLFFDHSPWLPGITFNYVGFVMPLEDIGSVGVNITALTSDEFEVTTVDQPMGTGETFSSTSVAVGMAYARNLTDRFSIGANFKFISESILNSQATGFAFDIGTIYNTPFRGIRLGVSISNFGTDLQIDGDDLNVRVDIAPNQEGNNQSVVGRLNTDDFSAPLIMRVGISWDAINRPSNRLTFSIDGLNPNDNEQSINIGAEYGLFNETLVLRGGYNELFLEDREKGLTLGAGVNYETSTGIGFSGGYAFQNLENLDAINRFSFELRF